MIKYTEVRIGNLVNKSGQSAPINAGDFLKVDLGAKELKEIESTPLTPEWLERCGFKRMNAGWINDSGSISFYDASQNEEGWFTMEYGTRNYRARFRYVHQLQNLYFALTGEELTIKE